MMKLDSGDDLVREVEALSGQNLFACYQCGKCTAGCPAAEAMDVTRTWSYAVCKWPAGAGAGI